MAVRIEVTRPFRVGASGLLSLRRPLVLFRDAIIGHPRMNVSRRNNRHAVTPLLRGIRIAKNAEHVGERTEPLRLGLGRNILRQPWPGGVQ